MKLGIAIEETWDFFNEIYAHLAAHHDVSLFQRRTVGLPLFNMRVNRHLFQRDLERFTRANDVIFFEWSSALLAAATQLPKRCGIVTRLHRYEMYRWVDEVNWNNVDTIILVSEAKRREFAARFPQHAGKVVVIPEAISLERFQPKDKAFTGDIGILCHLRPRKRVYELVLAFSELCKQRDDLHLHIGGGEAPGLKEYHDALHMLVCKLGLKDRVTFYGHVADPQAWLTKIDIFISNSYSEGLQVAPMEAIASGCFCLSHHWDGADELLPAENLYYTDNGLVERVLGYCQLPEAEKQRQKARLRTMVCERFNVDQTKVQIRELIEDVATTRSTVGVGL